MMNQPTGPRIAGRMGGTILQAFLLLYAITNFFTCILSAITACQYLTRRDNVSSVVLSRMNRSKIFLTANDLRHEGFSLNESDAITFYPRRLLRDSRLPYLLLAAVAGVTWIIASITLLFLFTKIRHFNHRAARYVFRVIGVATFVFLVIFYLTWANTLNFNFPFTFGWRLGKATVIVAHINL
jgi:hypothetical protein